MKIHEYTKGDYLQKKLEIVILLIDVSYIGSDSPVAFCLEVYVEN